LEKCGVQRKPAFPHLWNKTKNLDKKCRGLPPLKYYCVEKMKDDEAHEFMKWYKTNNTVGEFNLKNALIEYCSNDVQMLRSFFFKSKFTSYKIFFTNGHHIGLQNSKHLRKLALAG
jgi:hypothetical protein